jgi:hypothetical protein
MVSGRSTSWPRLHDSTGRYVSGDVAAVGPDVTYRRTTDHHLAVHALSAERHAASGRGPAH